jgi:hypothetical protein
MRPATVSSAVVFGFAIVSAPFHSAIGQERVDRSPLATRDLNRPVLRGLGIFAAATKPTYAWSLLPTFRRGSDQHVFGFSAAFKNYTRFLNLPFSVAVTDKVIDAADDVHNRIQVDLELDFPSLKLGSIALSPVLSGQYRHTSAISSSGEGVAELDATILDKPAGTLSFGGILYYDHVAPVGAASSSGATGGIDVDGTIGDWTDIFAEYDFKSDFAGESDYFVKLTQVVLHKERSKLALIGGWGKHNIFLFGVKATFPRGF